MKSDDDLRAQEFLRCLGNGKGRVTYEDENPDTEELEEDEYNGL